MLHNAEFLNNAQLHNIIFLLLSCSLWIFFCIDYYIKTTLRSNPRYARWPLLYATYIAQSPDTMLCGTAGSEWTLLYAPSTAQSPDSALRVTEGIGLCSMRHIVQSPDSVLCGTGRQIAQSPDSALRVTEGIGLCSMRHIAQSPDSVLCGTGSGLCCM
jgi:hypothetical protein